MSKILNFLFLAIIALFALGQLQRIEIHPGVAIYCHDLMIVIWLGIFALGERRQMIKLVRKAAAGLAEKPAVGLFAGWVLLGMLWSFLSVQPPTIIPFLYLARAVTYLLFAYLSAQAVGKDEAQGYWIIAGLLVLLLGLLQYFFLPDMRFMYLYSWDDHYYRLVGSLLDPAFTGMILVMCFGFLKMHYQKLERLHLATLLALLAGIVLTYSRSSYLAIIPLLLVAAQKNISPKKLTAIFLPAAVLILAVFLLATKPGGSGVNILRTDSIKARTTNISLTLSSLTVKTLVIGDGLFTRVQNQQTTDEGISHAAVPDNLFLMLVRAVGLPGLLLALYVLSQLGLYLYRQDKILFAVFVGLLIHSQFNNTLLQPFVFLYFLGGLMSVKTLK